jgi:hypothetical protein
LAKSAGKRRRPSVSHQAKKVRLSGALSYGSGRRTAGRAARDRPSGWRGSTACRRRSAEGPRSPVTGSSSPRPSPVRTRR